jgi:hypothetical protein
LATRTLIVAASLKPARWRNERGHAPRGNVTLTTSARRTEKIRAPNRKNRRCGKKCLHRCAIALMSRSPNFARACGRVPVGGHPDKRPDSRPE